VKICEFAALPVDRGRQLLENRQTRMNSELCLPGGRWCGFLLGRRWSCVFGKTEPSVYDPT
jgi:hypothetical protein